MPNTTYTGVIDPKLARLIVRRGNRLKFRADEMDDLQQQIVPALAAFQFDPSKGAARRTALVAVIDRQLQAIRRAKDRYQRRLDRSEPPCSAVTRLEPTALILDVQEAIGRLPVRQQRICRGLAEGHSMSDLARELQCTRERVRYLIALVRRKFQALGLDGWIHP